MTRIVAEESPRATGLTIDAAIDSYRLSLRAGNKSPFDDQEAQLGWLLGVDLTAPR